MTNLTYAQVCMLQDARDSTAGQIYVDDDSTAAATAKKLVDAGLGVLAHGYFILNQAGAASACMWPKAA